MVLHPREGILRTELPWPLSSGRPRSTSCRRPLAADAPDPGLAIALTVFGPGKLPDLGKSIRELKNVPQRGTSPPKELSKPAAPEQSPPGKSLGNKRRPYRLHMRHISRPGRETTLSVLTLSPARALLGAMTC